MTIDKQQQQQHLQPMMHDTTTLPLKKAGIQWVVESINHIVKDTYLLQKKHW